MPTRKSIRLLGVSISSFIDSEAEDEEQLPLSL
jgi:hypothetical protein